MSCEHRVDFAARLCHSCVSVLRRQLVDLPVLYRDAEHALVAQPHATERVSGGRGGVGISLRASTVDARKQAMDVLSSWALLTCRTRARALPGSGLDSLVDCLRANLAWLSQHEAAGDFSDEIAQVCVALRHAADPPRPEHAARILIGPCVEQGCAGRLSAVVGRGGVSGADICCDAHVEHRWPARSWSMLSRRLGRSS